MVFRKTPRKTICVDVLSFDLFRSNYLSGWGTMREKQSELSTARTAGLSYAGLGAVFGFAASVIMFIACWTYCITAYDFVLWLDPRSPLRRNNWMVGILPLGGVRFFSS